MTPAVVTHWLSAFWKLPFGLKTVLAVAAYGWARQWWQQRQQRSLMRAAKRWPTHRGRVVSVQAIQPTHRENGKNGWEGLLTYSYFANEIEIGEFRQPFRAEDEVDEWVRALRETTITVAVDPDDQRRSIWIEEEATTAKVSAARKAGAAQPETLPSWLEMLRQVMFWFAVSGTLFASWFEVKEMLALYRHLSLTSQDLFGDIAISAIASAVTAAYVFRKRFPGRSVVTVADQLSDPVVRMFLKVLGLLEGSAFAWLWLHWVSNAPMGDGLPYRVALSAAWTGLFAASAMELWVCGRHALVRHDLAPDSAT